MAKAELPTRAELLPNEGWDTRVHMFRAGEEVDTFALITQRYLVIIDTMTTPEMATDIMQSLQRIRQGRHLIVINTHAHYDHAWGNAIFADIESRYAGPIIGHAKTRALLLGQESRDKLAEMQAQQPRLGHVKLAPPNITFTDGLQIDGGDLMLDLIPTPGHTEDHIAVWVPQIRLLFAGDAAEHPFPHVTRAADLPILRASLAKMQALAPHTVLPCHGGTRDAELLARNLRYFDEVARHCQTVHDASTLPADWATDEQLPITIGFSYEEALRFLDVDPAKTPKFYQRFHLDAVRVTLAAQGVAG